MTQYSWTVNQNGLRPQLRCCYYRIRTPGQQLLFGATLAMASVMMLAKPSFANVVPNGLNTAVDTQDCASRCTVTDGSTRGANLFHSFEEFSVPRNSTVTFQHDEAIANIITRVTGGSVSRINGMIQTLVDGSTDDVGTADFFLLNPNGIVFGPNAQLNIGGSFIGSTADRLTFEDDTVFSVNDTNPLLTISVPTGLQFGIGPGTIRVAGPGNGLFLNPDATINRSDRPSGIDVPSGQTLALVGGRLKLDGGNLTAASGRIELGAVGENSNVGMDDVKAGWSLDYGTTATFGTLELANAASADVTGNNAGTIRLQGERITVQDGSSVLANTLTRGGGRIRITATESLQMSGISATIPAEPFTPMPTSAYIEISPGALGNGSSELRVKTPQLNLDGGAQIGLSMGGLGSSGEVNVKADTIQANSGSPTAFSGIFTAVLPVFPAPPDFVSPPPAMGLGGDLNIETDTLEVINGAQMVASTFGLGSAGNFTIEAKDVQVIGFNPGGSSTLQSASAIPPAGNGGQLTINTERLVVADGGQIATSTVSANPAGDLIVRATDSILIEGTTIFGSSGLFANAISDRNPDDGTITAFGGEGGSILVETNTLVVRDSGSVNVSNQPSTPTPFGAPGTGSAGNLTIMADRIQLYNEGLLTADTVDGDRGNITLQSDLISLQDESMITTSATGTASGGNLTINTGALVAFDNSDLTANAEDNFGGRVTISADGIFGTQFRPFLTPNSDITATSALGPQFSGVVELNTPDVDPSQGTIALPADLLNKEDRLFSACEPITESTLVLIGQGGLPPGPHQSIQSGSLWQDFRLADAPSQTRGHQSISTSDISPHSAEVSSSNPASIVEAQRWSVEANGQVSLVAQTQTRSLARNHSQCQGTL